MAVSKCTKGNFTNGSRINTESKSSGRDRMMVEGDLCILKQYVLKALGAHSFLCALRFPLIWYQFVQNALRESEGS